MKIRKKGLAVAVTALAVATAQAADISKWTGGANGNWTNTASWNNGLVPGTGNPTYTARFDGAGEGAIIDSAIGTVVKLELGRSSTAGTLDIQTGGSATFGQFRIAARDGTDTGTVDINGGDLTINGGNHGIGYAGTGIVNLNSGTFHSTDDITVGRGGAAANGTLTVSGGALSSVGQISVGGRMIAGVPTGGVGAFTMSAGTATIGTDLKIGNGGNGTLTLSGTADMTVGRLLVSSDDVYAGTANLNDGTLQADVVVIGENGTLTLSSAASLTGFTNMNLQANGLFEWEGDRTDDIETLALAGELTGSDGVVNIDDLTFGVDYDQVFGTGSELVVSKYDSGSGNTSVYTVIPEPATLGMLGMMGVGMLFIRRRFHI